MSSLSAKDRVSLCSFSFSDGRRCRTPRFGDHPHFCFDHAQKEARAHTSESLGSDMDFFFSGNYISACDLSAALARLIPAVLRGDVKSKTAHTVAYLVQTLMQAIHLSQHEYINAFGTDGWRHSIRMSVNQNSDHISPPDPECSGGLQAGTTVPPEPPAQSQPPADHTASLEPASAASTAPQPAVTPANCHSERSEDPAFASSPSCHPERSEGSLLNRAASTTEESNHLPSTQPVPSVAPHTPLPPTSAEFAQQILAGQKSSRPPQSSRPSSPEPGADAPTHASSNAPAPRLSGPASVHSPATTQPAPTAPQPAKIPANSHSSAVAQAFRPEEPPFSSSPACHPERSEGSLLKHAASTTGETPHLPAAQPAPSLAPPTPRRGPDRDAPWLDFGRKIPPDSKLL